ncbi:MAG: adenosine deaminase [Micropruina sp.]|uniref:adenosine deaminase n=1 Tax=Micropruina sp. TaxID=2737536 RepID=UPI0039E63720
MTRDLDALPKAHLHLHFTGSMSVSSLHQLAELAQIGLHDSLVDAGGVLVPRDQRGWFRFQRLYEMARDVVRSEDAMRFIVAQAARDDAAEGSRRLELQVDPSSYAPHVGGLAAALEIVLDEARRASAETGVQVAIVVAASRVRHPLDARTIARLAARHAGENGVIAFGLSNNERSGVTADWEPAFRIARNAGLPGVPHGGELRGPRHLRQVVEHLRPARIGHGVRSAEDPALLDDLIAAGIALEVCPASNVHLGIYPEIGDVPLRRLVDAGATVALGADDPLLFRSRLTDQYRLARERLGFSDSELAELARGSIRASLAADADKARWLAEVDDWLNSPEMSTGGTPE